MKTEKMGSRFGRFGLALSALSLGLLVTGCEPECVDQFDCASKGNPPEGRQYVCESERCVLRDVTPAPTDAGTEPVDSGTPDSGTPDSGTDAGVACADLPHDSKLGTLQLQTGYAVATETATLPEGIIAVTAIPSGAEFKLYGLNGTDDSLYALGTWPSVTLGGAPLQSIYAEADRDGGTKFPSGYLVNDGTRLLTGYTTLGPITNIPGTALVYDTLTPASSKYISANGNFSAAGLDGGFLINGQGLEGTSESGNAVYALRTGTSSFQGSKLATFPVAGASSGFTAVATNGVAVLGYSDSTSPFANHLRAVAPGTYTEAFTGGTTVALTDTNAPGIYSGTDIKSVTGFGEGVALHRGPFTSTKDVARIPLPLGGITPGSVTPGELETVLTTSNTCTSVVLMTPMGSDLLVGVSDKQGRRLVLLKKQ